MLPKPHSTEPILLANTGYGTITLFRKVGLFYSLHFNRTQAYLTPTEFCMLHHEILEFSATGTTRLLTRPHGNSADLDQVALLTTAIYLRFSDKEICQLKDLLGKATLKICLLNRIWNDLN